MSLHVSALLTAFVFLVINSFSYALPTAAMSRAEQLAAALAAMQERAALAGVEPVQPAALVKCGLPAVFQLRAYEKLLGKQAGISEFLARPTDADFPEIYDSPGGHFKIHYTTAAGDRDRIDESYGDHNSNGVPDYPEIVAMVCDSVWDHHINQRGFREPINDENHGGGDARYDVYIRDVGGQVYGITWADQAVADGPMVKATSWMELDNHYEQYQGYDTRPLDAMRVTVAHEFLHAIHLAYDAEELCTDANCTPALQNPYWFEMSSVWAEEDTYDNINDYYLYLEFYLDQVHRSLRYISETGLNIYGAALMPIYLSQLYGRDLVRLVWERCGEVPGENLLSGALQGALDEISGGAVDLEKAWLEYGKALYFTGTRARPGKFFEEAANYAMVPDNAGSPLRPYIRYYSQYPVTKQQASDNAFLPSELGFNYLVFSTGTIDSVFTMNFEGAVSTPIPTDWRIAMTGYDRFNLNAPLKIDPTRYQNFGLIQERNLTAVTDLLGVVTIVNPELRRKDNFYRFEVTNTSVVIKENTVTFVNTKFLLSEGDDHAFYVIVQPAAKAQVNMTIFNAAGEEVYQSGTYEPAAGERYPIQWNGRNNDREEVASGVYVVQVRIGDETTHKKILVIR